MIGRPSSSLRIGVIILGRRELSYSSLLCGVALTSTSIAGRIARQRTGQYMVAALIEHVTGYDDPPMHFPGAHWMLVFYLRPEIDFALERLSHQVPPKLSTKIDLPSRSIFVPLVFASRRWKTVLA